MILASSAAIICTVTVSTSDNRFFYCSKTSAGSTYMSAW